MRRGETPVELTPTEFTLLRFLLHNPRRVLSKRQILDHVWQYDFGGDANIVETYVSLPAPQARPARPAPDPHRAPGRVRAAGAVRCRCGPACSLIARGLAVAGPDRGRRRHLRGAALVPARPRRPHAQARRAAVAGSRPARARRRARAASPRLGPGRPADPGPYVEVRDPAGRRSSARRLPSAGRRRRRDAALPTRYHGTSRRPRSAPSTPAAAGPGFRVADRASCRSTSAR